jgi:hypothetical protein
MSMIERQTPERIAYEAVILLAIEELDICRSDAQSILEAKPQLLDSLYNAGVPAVDAAKQFTN